MYDDILCRNKVGVLYLVVPCYNEEEVIADSAKKMKDKIDPWKGWCL